MKIVVAGAGYVGLVTAVCLAEKGHKVTCVDVDTDKINKLQQCKPTIFEPELEDLMKKNKNNIRYTVDGNIAYKEADVIFIGVGTPEKQDGSANLEYVYNVIDTIIKNLKKDTTIVVKSTVPIGTNDKIERYINNNIKSSIKVDIVSNPEFLSQGTAIQDTLNAKRIIIGTNTEKAKKVMSEVYKNFNQPIIMTDRNSAEMIKYASNDFLALKISYINEIANLCEIVGANIEDVSNGMGLDDRIGNKFLNAGVGYGGSCFPKDTKALHWLAQINDYELKTVKATIEVNKLQRLKLIKKAKKYYNNLENLNIAILGLTFKPDTDDLRESPAIDNISILLEERANITVYDPIGENNCKKLFDNRIKYRNTIEETLKNADICFIFTAWDEIKNIDANTFLNLMTKPIVIDGRNCFNLTDIPKGMIYDSIGRQTIGYR